jgi:serine/threonine protein kinase
MRQQLPAIIRQAADGLHYLHTQGWLHRDVKPDNFLVNDTGLVKLIDFAIAERPKSGWAKLLSGRAKIQGTRSYMSPEQIRGERLDVRSDVYSFGCMLYELFSGRPPFTGGNPDELLQKHLSSPVPVLPASSGEVSSEFAHLVSRMMSKKRELRPASMQEFMDTLGTMRVLKVARR